MPSLLLEENIWPFYAVKYLKAEEVLEHCDWLRDRELYVNPNGIRMARGIATNDSGYVERRYYVEEGSRMILISINEDERFYQKEACEEVILEMANNVYRK